MSNATYFVQECPTCGRGVQIRVEHLGRKVVCRHCQGELIAADMTNVRCDRGASSDALVRRANELLNAVSHRSAQSR
jgi:Zn finger protein HypA/HybF involved in hydrogenase expression